MVQNLESPRLSGRVDSTSIGQPSPPPAPRKIEPLLNGPQIKQTILLYQVNEWPTLFEDFLPIFTAKRTCIQGYPGLS